MKKIKIIKPFMSVDAGISCCCMILDYYDAKYSIVELKNEIDVGRDGVVWADIQQLFNMHNMSCDFLDINDLSSIDLQNINPFIGKICNNYVVVEKIDSGIAHIVDPLKGRYEIDVESLIKVIDRNIVVSRPRSGFKKVNRKYYYWKYYLKSMLSNRKIILFMMIFSLISYGLNIVSPVLLQKVIDNAMLNDRAEVNKYIIIFIASIFIGGIINYFKGDTLVNLRLNLDRVISKNAIKKLIFVPYKFYESRNNSEIMYGISCTGTIREVFASQMINGIIDFGATIFIIIYIFRSNKYIGSIACIMFLINAIFIMLTNPKILEANQGYIGEQAALNGSQIEVINTIQSIKMSAMERETYKQWKNNFNNFQNKYELSQKIINSITSMSIIIKMISPFVMLLMAIRLYQNGMLTIGEVLAIHSLSNTFFNMASSLFTCFWGFTQSNIYMERMADIVLQETESNIGRKKVDVKGNISFDNVCFSYKKNGEKILSNINLSIKKGEKIAIVGKSGSGKSTLAKLFVGLYKPTGGNIIFEGVSQNELDMSYVCSNLGIISQEATLFNKTIYDNIKMNRSYISDEDIINAAKIVGIHDEIESMPLKYSTVVADLGSNFSGGQRQRIVLARAIAGNPKLIVMDEATSALDNINEAKITSYLRDAGSTQIIIAHRFSSIIDADRIVVLDRGRIQGIGSHNYLLQTCELYRNLFEGTNQNDMQIDCNEGLFDNYKKQNLLHEKMVVKTKRSKKLSSALLCIILLFSILVVTFVGLKGIDRVNNNQKISNKIEWKDKAFCDYAQEFLGKKASDIKKEELYVIQKINISNVEIGSLEDLEKFPCLVSLELDNVGIKNIEDIGKCTRLKTLKLSNNFIEDIQSLCNLQELEALYLDNNRITSASCINNMKDLQYIDLSGNDIIDYNVITSNIQVKKKQYSMEVVFNYNRMDNKYAGWKIELWNNSLEKHTYDFDQNGKAICSLDVCNSIIAYRIINEDPNLTDVAHARYFDIKNYDSQRISVYLRENRANFTIK